MKAFIFYYRLGAENCSNREERWVKQSFESVTAKFLTEDACCIAATTLSIYCSRLTHTHTGLTALCPGLPGWAGTRKVKPIWILLKQETVSGSGINWAICKSAPSSRQITLSSTPPLSFYRPDALPAAQPTASKHWRQKVFFKCRKKEINYKNYTRKGYKYSKKGTNHTTVDSICSECSQTAIQIYALTHSACICVDCAVQQFPSVVW